MSSFIVILALVVGAGCGVILYQAIINHDKLCALAVAVTFAFREADRFLSASIVQGFMKGWNQ